MDEDVETISDNTIKPANDRRGIKSDTMKKSPQKNDLSRQDLCRLLSFLEGELQARDVVISTIKSETAKQLLYQAKYGRLGLNDPLAALQRDSETCGSTDDFDESAVGQMYESQLGQLEKLIAVQRRAHHRAKQVLAQTERRHGKIVLEFEKDRQRRAQDAAQGDDVCMMLEKERERLKQELEIQKNEQGKIEKEMEKMKLNLQDEKERRKEIVLYLLQERRQLMIRLMEERLKVQNLTGAPSQSASTSFKNGSEDSVNKLKAELESAKKELQTERDESASLREIVRTQEDDLNLIRQTILAKTKRMHQQQQQQQQIQTNSVSGNNEKAAKIIQSQANSTTTTVSKSNGQGSSSGTVRYQILTRPAAPGSVETSKFVSSEQNSGHNSLNSPSSSSPSSTIRLLNPAFQPQLSPQSKGRQQLPPYTMSGGGAEQVAVVSPTVHYSSTMKIPPTPSQFATPGLSSVSASSTSNSYSSPASLRRPPLTNSPVKNSPVPNVPSLVNGYTKDSKQRSNAPGSSFASIYSSIGSTRPGGAATPTCESDSLRLGSTNRVALTQLPANFSFPSSSMGQRNASSSSSSSTSTNNDHQTKRKANGGEQAQVSSRSTSKEKTKRNVAISDDSTIEPEIAHLQAVINSMAIDGLTNEIDNCQDEVEFDFENVSPSHRSSGIEQSLQVNYETPSNHQIQNATSSQHNNNTWTTINRRFPTTIASPTVANRATTVIANAYQTAPFIMSKRAPTPSPNNRIPLPLNGVLTKSFSSSSAVSSIKADTESMPGGRSAIGNRMTKAMSGIAGKVQKKMAPNVKRNEQQSVRSTQV